MPRGDRYKVVNNVQNLFNVVCEQPLIRISLIKGNRCEIVQCGLLKHGREGYICEQINKIYAQRAFTPVAAM